MNLTKKINHLRYLSNSPHRFILKLKGLAPRRVSLHYQDGRFTYKYKCNGRHYDYSPSQVQSVIHTFGMVDIIY